MNALVCTFPGFYNQSARVEFLLSTFLEESKSKHLKFTNVNFVESTPNNYVCFTYIGKNYVYFTNSYSVLIALFWHALDVSVRMRYRNELMYGARHYMEFFRYEDLTPVPTGVELPLKIVNRMELNTTELEADTITHIVDYAPNIVERMYNTHC